MLNKQVVNIDFSQGLDLKSDPKRVQIGKFLALNNSIFDKNGGLVKRNGFKDITHLPNTLQTTLTTHSNNLLATGSNLYAYSQDTNQWLDKGTIQPVTLDTLSLVNSTTSQTAVDTAIASNGCICLTYMDNSVAYYQVSDSVTGQQIVGRTALPSTASNPRVFWLDRYFIVTFMTNVLGTPNLKFIAIPISTPETPTIATVISTLINLATDSYDGAVANNRLYIGFGSTGTTIKLSYVTSALGVSSPVTLPGANVSTKMSVCVDSVNGYVYVTFYDGVTNIVRSATYDSNLGEISFLRIISSPATLNNLTTTAYNNTLTILSEVTATDRYIGMKTLPLNGAVSSEVIILRGVGLASKSFMDVNTNKVYVLVAFGSSNQPTYFLTDSNGNIYLRLNYSNGGGFITSTVLPSVTSLNDTYYMPYLNKSQLVPVNKGTNIAAGTPTNAFYTQTGVNLAKFQLNTSGQYSSEIANTLHLTGGMLWQYDGMKPVENGFHVYPEGITVTTATGSGNITAQKYFYSFCYEWTDNQGNLHRSAPSVPVSITTTTATSTNTILVPTLRLTYKVGSNPVRIVGYRYSVGQPIYYQFTSVSAPVINDTAADYVSIVDTLADSSILGQTILYTTGGVIENIAPPANIATALFKNRLFLVDAENRNLLWYSKQVIQNTPVEMSDLLTVYVAPTSGSQGSTGEVTALSAMDDKLIIFKPDAIYYMTGLGPDNTGANNDFNDPVFITSAVGTSNPSSIVLTPAGLMFQSDKGIWLLGRDLQTTYIGAPVEFYNDYVCKSAKVIPGTNQVRFVMEQNITLMYDFYYAQWGTFSNIKAVSNTLYQGKDTYLNSLGYVLQETQNYYLDGSSPVLLSFTTSWISLAGIQGMERFYEMNLLGSYFTPFKLQVQINYNYNQSPPQSTIVVPDNYSPNYGGLPVYGSGEFWGGPGNVLEARVFPEIQKCETFQLIITEIYDPSLGVAAGQGLQLSAVSAVVGVKRGYRTNKSGQSFG